MSHSVASQQVKEEQRMEGTRVPSYRDRTANTTIPTDIWKAYAEAREVLGMSTYQFVQYCIRRVLRDLYLKERIKTEVKGVSRGTTSQNGDIYKAHP